MHPIANPLTLAFEVMLAPFSPLGVRLGYGAAVADPANLVPDTINLGIDFQLAAYGTQLYGKGQAGIVQVAPIVFRIPEPDAPALAAGALLALAAAARRGMVRAWTSRRSSRSSARG